MKNSKLFKSIMYAIQGAIVGVGAILPGVSGGVLCVAFGIYEPMMAMLTNPVKSFKTYYKMFVPFLIGWVLGFIFLAKGVEYLFGLSPTVALMLFFGLICGTLPELIKSSEKSEPESSWTPFVITLALAFLFFHVLENGSSVTMAPNFGSFVLCGVLWGLSLIVPGMSSSTILIILGLFEPLTAGIGSLEFNVLLPFVIGIAGTTLLLARVVNMLYTKHYPIMSKIILGFVIASSLKILPSSFGGIGTLIVSIICFAGGFAVARYMDCAKDK